MMHLKNSIAFMLLLSVGTLLPADQASQFFGQAQKAGVDALNYVQNGQVGQMISGAFGDTQRWVDANPKLAGALGALIVCGCLFAWWRKNLKRRLEQDLDEAWMDGYEVAQDECDELLNEALEQELGAMQMESYNAGWQSAMSQGHQMQRDPACVTECQDNQQEPDRCITVLVGGIPSL